MGRRDPGLTRLTSSLGRDSLIVVLEFRKVHGFLGAVHRLLDLRGRNALLMTIRKLVAAMIQMLLNKVGCRAYVLRCGGNRVYVVANCSNPARVADTIAPYISLLGSVLARVLEPLEIHLSLKIGADGRILTYFSETLRGTSVRERIDIGGEGYTVDYLVCDVCGAPSYGVVVHDEADGVNELLRHVARNEPRLCSRDLLSRLLGRAFNSAIVTTLIRTGCCRGNYPPYRDTVFIEFSASRCSGECSLRFWFARHPTHEESLLDDVAVLEVCLSVPGLEEVCSRAIVVGFRSSALASARDRGSVDLRLPASSNLRSEFRNLDTLLRSPNPDSIIGKLDSLWSEVERNVDEMYERVAKMLRRVLSGLTETLACVDRFQIVARILDDAISDEVVSDVFPVLLREEQPRTVVDRELSYVNLGGHQEVLDLLTISSLSRGTNFIAFIRADGDRFGVLASARKLVSEIREADPGLAKVIDDRFRELAGGSYADADYDSLPIAYAWDYVVEVWLRKVFRQTLLIQYIIDSALTGCWESLPRVGSLVIYMGGDENLLILPLVREVPESRVESLGRIVMWLRTLMLYMASKAISTLVGGDLGIDLDRISIALARSRIATLSAAIILSSPKFPSYLITAIADECVELAKEAGRDATTIFTLDSVEIPWPSPLWLSLPILAPIPNEVFVAEGGGRMMALRLDKLLRNAYRVVYSSTEIVDIEKAVLDYTLRRGGLLNDFVAQANQVLSEVLRQYPYRDLGRIAQAVAGLRVFHSYYASLETVKLVDKGV